MRFALITLGWVLVIWMPPEGSAMSKEWSPWTEETCSDTGKQSRGRIQEQKRACSPCSKCPSAFKEFGIGFCFKELNCWDIQGTHNITDTNKLQETLDIQDRLTRCIIYKCREGLWFCTHYCCDSKICKTEDDGNVLYAP